MISSESQGKGVALAIPPLLALFCIGGVAEWAFISVSIAAIISACFVLKDDGKKPSKPILLSSLVVLATAALVCLPLPISMHHVFQPKLATLTIESLAVVETEWQPLALRPRKALLNFVFWSAMMLYGWACCSHFSRARRLEHSIKFLLIGLSLFCMLGILQRLTDAGSIYWASGIPIAEIAREPFFGSLVNPNHAGALLAAALPLGLALEFRWSSVIAPILIFGLILTGSRGGLLAGAAGGGLYVLLSQKGWLRWLIASASAVILIASLSMDLTHIENTSSALEEWSSYRFDIWRDSIELINSAPVLGLGAGGFVDAFATVKSSLNYTSTHHAHQELIELIASKGWIGSAGILILLGLAARQGISAILKAEGSRRKQWRTACFCGFVSMILAAQIGFPLKLPANAMLFVLLIGGMAGSQWSHRKIKPTWAYGLVGISSATLIGLGMISMSPSNSFSSAKNWFNEGEKQRRQKENDAALLAYKSAIKAAPLYARALRQHALTQRHNDTDMAIFQAELASQMAPNTSISWIALAELYRLNGQSSESWGAWKKALALDLPNNDKGDSYIRSALKTGNNPNLAAQEALPDRLDRRRRAALILYSMGYGDQAQFILRESIENDSASRKISAILKLRSGDHQGAWEQIQSMAKTDCEMARIGSKALLGMALTRNSPQQKGERYGLLAMKQTRIAIDLCGREESLSKNLILARLIEGSADALIEGELMVRRKPRNVALRRWVIKTALKNKMMAKAQMHLEELKRRNQATENERRTLELMKTNQDADYLRELER